MKLIVPFLPHEIFLRLTVKATKFVGRPAAFVGPLQSTKERCKFKRLEKICLPNPF